MFVFLSKFLPLFIYPVGILFILIGLALLTHQHSKWQRAIIITALLLLWLAGNRWSAYSLVRSLEWRYMPPKDIPKADVIVVLGGGTDPAQFPRSTVELNGAGDRVFYAYWLYKQGSAPHILLSGGNISWLNYNESTPAEDMASILAMLDVPQQTIWLETNSQNTYENALFCYQFLVEKGINKIILVTSAMHMPRSVSLFEHQGFEVIPAPTDYRVTQAGWQHLWEAEWTTQLLNFFPSVGNLSMITESLKEYLGIWVYKHQGWQ